MRAPTPVTRGTPILDALLLMEESRQNDLPVVGAERRLVGGSNGAHIMEIALRVFQRTEKGLARAKTETPENRHQRPSRTAL